MDLWNLVKRGFMYYPDNVAVIHGDQRVTYRQLEQRINRLSNALSHLGLKKGDSVSVLGENSLTVLEAQYAIIKNGLVWVPLNMRNHPKEHAHCLNNAESKALIMLPTYAEGIASVQGELETCRHFIVDGPGFGDMMRYDDLMAAADDTPTKHDIDENDNLCIMHTSGTTGQAKGVVHTHKTWVLMSFMTSCLLDIKESDVAIYVAPINHGSGILIGPHFMMGVPNILVSHLDVDYILQTIQKEKVTTMWLAPTIIYFLLAYPNTKRYDFSSLRNLCYSSAPIAVEKLKEALSVFGRKFNQTYGLVECPMITNLTAEEHVVDGTPAQTHRLGSAGRELILTEVRVVDDQGRALPPGEKGEVITKSPLVMKEYWKNPEATAEALRGGWLYSGDMGYLDEEGYLYIADRKKDMIITGGYNVYPKEVEDVIYTHPSVFEAAVIGIPDDLWGESVLACVTLKPGQPATEEEIIALCKNNLASYKKPKSVKFVYSLPKSLTGKILKTELRQAYWAGKERQVV
ncbi:MAG: long-chain-fatty-acid--CoA ligase [Thermodesulfobacteriota bacterium]